MSGLAVNNEGIRSKCWGLRIRKNLIVKTLGDNYSEQILSAHGTWNIYNKLGAPGSTYPFIVIAIEGVQEIDLYDTVCCLNSEQLQPLREDILEFIALCRGFNPWAYGWESSSDRITLAREWREKINDNTHLSIMQNISKLYSCVNGEFIGEMII